eukprot:6186777-Pleurochrysis_carterae.AAC.3
MILKPASSLGANMNGLQADKYMIHNLQGFEFDDRQKCGERDAKNPASACSRYKCRLVTNHDGTRANPLNAVRTV